ncbi:MAG: P1 family peptidase [Gemmatimonadota bacterium]
MKISPLANSLLTLLLAIPLMAQEKPRARDLGVPFDGAPGPNNAITDVAGVAVGHTTVIRGEGPLVVGEGPVRTGVTAILPRGSDSYEPSFAAWFPLNGNGEMTGTTWVEESGLLTSPILITNTHSVGMVHHATLQWMVENQPGFRWALPVVAETYDGTLNDINGFHIQPEHVFAALNGASSGPVVEGAVGGGTGMICNGFKGGIGTSSRTVSSEWGQYTVGVLVQCNYGSQAGLRIAGVPVGEQLIERGVLGRCLASEAEPSRSFLRGMARCSEGSARVGGPGEEHGSIIIVLATDAPLLPHQLERIIKRTTLGLGREGSIASNFSGDIFIAFSTANTGLEGEAGNARVEMIPNSRLDPLFLATIQATEEAVTNAMVAAETMTGADYIRVNALPDDQLREILQEYGRLEPSPNN